MGIWQVDSILGICNSWGEKCFNEQSAEEFLSHFKVNTLVGCITQLVFSLLATFVLTAIFQRPFLTSRESLHTFQQAPLGKIINIPSNMAWFANNYGCNACYRVSWTSWQKPWPSTWRRLAPKSLPWLSTLAGFQPGCRGTMAGTIWILAWRVLWRLSRDLGRMMGRKLRVGRGRSGQAKDWIISGRMIYGLEDQIAKYNSVKRDPLPFCYRFASQNSQWYF